ncbi:MAG: hypothetical protein KDA78_18165, partial [Planctomycetaceae bacterium]|nr:hypothetical protein [Planctomycetaceae bacterium]
MSQSAPQRDWLEQLLQRYLLPGLAVMYLLAAFLPQLGVWLRSTPVWGTETLGLGKVTMVNLLLAGLLFNTGLSVPLKELFCLTRHPKLVSLALAIRVTSCGLIILMALLLGWFLHGNVWNELQLGLILVAVMPVANSSAGWSHHSDANVGLSMWLILISVLLSPLLVPGLLEISAPLTAAGFRAGYSQLARGYAGSFVMTWVIIPAVLGVIFRSLFLKNSYPQWKSRIKLLTSLFLLLLNYANGAVSLPGL